MTTRDTFIRSVEITPKWFTVAEVAAMLGYGLTKTKMLIISGDLKSLKDGRSRRILPEWVDDYIARRVAEAERNAA
jgi:excisionase family DNA binding protein